MAITYRLIKGSPLTHQELDDNFRLASSSLAALEAATGSFLYSGSFDGSSTLTLYSGDVNYDIDLSSLGGSGADLTELNLFTGSIQTEVDNLTAETGSYLYSGSFSSTDNVITLYSEDQNYELNLNSLTGSTLISASVVNNVITFEKGDGTTFNITVNTGSGGGGGSTDYVSNVAYNTGSISFTGVGNAFDGVIQINDLTASLISNDQTSSFVTNDQTSSFVTNDQTSSFVTNDETGSFLTTGSVVDNTLTFEKADGTSFTLTVNTGSGGGGGSTDYVSTVVYNTGSIQFTGVGNAFDGVIQINDLTASLVTNDQTSSFVTNDQTGSFMTTGSVTNNTITFTKGDGSTFSLTVNTGSGGSATDITDLNNFTGSIQTEVDNLTAATSSYLYSGSFDGGTNVITLYSDDQNYDLDLSGLAGGGGGGFAITASDEGVVKTSNARSFDFVGNGVVATNSGNAVTVTVTQANTSSFVTNDQTSSFVTNDQTSSFVTNDQTSSFVTNDETGSFLTTGSVTDNTLTFEKADGTSFTLTVDTGSGGGSTDYVSNVVYNTGSIQFTGVGNAFDGVIQINDLTASLVSNDQTGSFVTNDQTSSFVTNDETGSFMTTGSVTDNTITFTKGDGSTFSLTVDTGSGGSGTNIYNTDGTLTGNRTVTANGNSLSFDFTDANFVVNSADSQRVTIAGLPIGDQPQVVAIDGNGNLKAMNTSSLVSSGGGGNPDTPLNSLQFNSASAFGGSELYYDEANIRLGVNVVSPSRTLHVSSSVAQALRLESTVATNQYIQFFPNGATGAGSLIGGVNVNDFGILNTDGGIQTNQYVSASGEIFFPRIASATRSNVIGYDTATGEITYQAAGGGGSDLPVSSSGTGLTSAASSMDFEGNLVSTTVSGDDVTVAINSGSVNQVNLVGATANADYRVLLVDDSGMYDETLYVDNTNGLTFNPSLDFLQVKGEVIAYYASDRSLKDNVTPIADPLEKLESINGYEFDWNDNQGVYEGHDIGVIAQEIEEVMPELVTTRESGVKAVKYEKLTAFLISVVKEQQTQIKDLKVRVENLEK